LNGKKFKTIARKKISHKATGLIKFEINKAILEKKIEKKNLKLN
jgi:hypothetical protein